VRTEAGFLIIARNQEVTPSVILKLKNYYAKGVPIGDLVISQPPALAASNKK
jgi:hypothetical protein